MIDLWYLNTKNIDKEQVKVLSETLPCEMVHEIDRLRNHEDRRLKLLGKLMIKKYYEDKNLQFKWSEYQLSPAGKPYYNESKKFNISHSGDYVVVAFSDVEIGTDIEKVTDFDITSIISYLHPYEAERIKNASNRENTFFKVWTRKEAYLKAIGKGIIDGLSNENCLQDELYHKEKWHLHSLPIIADYQIALCTQIPDCPINVRELLPGEF